MFVNAIMYYKVDTVGNKTSSTNTLLNDQVKDPISAVTNVDDYSGSARSYIEHHLKALY